MLLQYSSAEQKSACQGVVLPIYDSEWPLNGGVTAPEQTCWDLVFCSIAHSAAFAWHLHLHGGDRDSSPAASRGETHSPSRPDTVDTVGTVDQDDHASSAEAEIAQKNGNPGQPG
jgi:hypothetical protein